jgi:hypothetical protein
MKEGNRYTFAKSGVEFIVCSVNGNIIKCQEVENGVTVSKIFVMPRYELQDKLKKKLVSIVS